MSTCCDLRNALNRIKLALPGWQAGRKTSANFGRMEVGCRRCGGRLCQSLLRLVPPVVTANRHCCWRLLLLAAGAGGIRNGMVALGLSLLAGAVAGGGRCCRIRLLRTAAAGGGCCWRRAFAPTRREG